ncbi:metal ABC transporter permease [Nocardia asteroides]|uniref:ABC transporter permease protein n=1 Tax=Nocardia asteroides NBRC 15531 TaxID=1110697 RepID=U5EB86_NOCAS|nr:metal ABC transporter permease [Nocardia asteroides]TLF62261.1 metal ABC transporter permease [Nocardia asteroides NBRC 15531]UGT48135.1 metal ABC transporter permease [Nocardia asteroides]SFN69841.1 zinc/manganese transport system permease protein [Nocardia asteroides]VEG32911.1 High-affinity zinc uptake system membrane protein znuB [Nocardia asteroides]GAD84615.1 putative ABC transporter permease protein [Nocardia asteroides NBRC 15531]
MDKLNKVLHQMFDLGTTADLLTYDFVQQALLASALLGLLAGLIGPLIVSRQMSFAVHGTSELSLTGASAALLAGVGVGIGAIAGSVVAAVLFGWLGSRARERDSVIAVVLSFGLGLSVLFLWLAPDRAGSKFSLLTGQVASVGYDGLALLLTCTAAVLAVLAVVYRPLLFASSDPEVAVARGVPVRALSVIFAVLLGITAAFGVQIVGALLVLALLITPAAAAAQVTASPLRATVLSVIFAEVAAVGGLLLSLAPGVPVSTFVTAISFAIYLVCRFVGHRNRRLAPAR